MAVRLLRPRRSPTSTIVTALAARTGTSFDSTPYNSQRDTPDEKTNK